MSKEDEWDENNKEEGKTNEKSEEEKNESKLHVFQKRNQVKKALYMWGNEKQGDFQGNLTLF